MRHALGYSCVLAILCFAPGTAFGLRYTPLEWQALVLSNPNPEFIGQRKNTTWIRDKNRNFIDDEIDARFAKGDSVDIIVDLNQCLTYEQIDALVGSSGGRLAYIAKLITCAYVDRARVNRLDSLAVRPEVAMIEWQTQMFPINDTATRAVQSRKSTTYTGASAEDVPPGRIGTGVGVAILDTGIKTAHEAFAGAFVAGFDATIYEDANGDNIDDSCGGSLATCGPDDESGDGKRNPEPTAREDDHGTAVASIALGRSSASGKTCRDPGSGAIADCAGTARGAGLVNVKACVSNTLCYDIDVMESLDWVGLNRDVWKIQVANISIGDCTDDDGTSAKAEAVSYLAAMGIIPVVGHGNAGSCKFSGVTESPGHVRTGSPGSSSYAITVSAVNDHSSVSRGDDDHYTNYLVGPRKDYVSASSTPLAMKPDLCAPGQSIMAAAGATTFNDRYFSQSGTSMAAPFVSGAAAIIREIRPSISAGSLKSLLLATADRGITGFTSGATWDPAYGAGELNIGAAAMDAATTDVTFPNCIGAGSSAGAPCELTSPMASWDNHIDITTWSPPQVGIPNTITAQVLNSGSASASVVVNFGIYAFSAGTSIFHHIGSSTGTVGPGATAPFTQPWTPEDSDHQCVQVSVDFALDTNDGNNVTQRNLAVAASKYRLRVENPLTVPAVMRVVPKSSRRDWLPRLDTYQFTIDPIRDCPRTVQVNFDAPKRALPGAFADCDLAVYARPIGSADSILVGGATVRTVVPKGCRLEGRVLDSLGVAVPYAAIMLTPMEASHQGAGRGYRTISAKTTKAGNFSVEPMSYVPYRVTIENPSVGSGSMTLAWWCGNTPLTFELRKKSVHVIRSESGG